jgi:hypothetical protein
MAKSKKTSSSSGRTIKLPGSSKMSGSGGSVRVPEGDYKVKIAKIEQTETKDDQRSMLVLHYKIVEGKHKGKVIKDRIVLVGNDEKKDTLWKLSQVLEALEKKVPDKAFRLNIDGLIDGVVAATISDGDPYKNRIKSEIGDINHVSILDEEDEDEEDEDDEESDDEDEEDEDLEDVDLDDEL